MQSLISHLYRKAWWLSQHTANRQPTDGYIFIMPTMGTKEDTGLLPPHYTRRYILGVLIISADIRGCSLLTNWFRRAKHTDTTILICRSHPEIPPYSFIDLIKRFHSTILICIFYQEIPPYSSVDLIKRFKTCSF